MQKSLEFTGERFVPGLPGEIAHEHWHRYAFARRFITGKRVLDVASGDGYGSALLAAVAGSVVGVDVDVAAIGHARTTYAGRTNLRFEVGSAAALPLPDASVDVVVSFETIEHLPREMQAPMLAEIARVLAADGMLMLSAPNPVEYSVARNYHNPFHLHEPPRAELDALLAVAFPWRRWFRQRRYFGSAIWTEATAAGVETFAGDGAHIAGAVPPEAMYYIVVAARSTSAAIPEVPALSLFSDPAELELARLDGRAADVLRLDGQLHDRDAALDRQTAHVQHLETLIAERERIIVERDGQLDRMNEAQQALIAEREQAAHQRDILALERDALAAERTTALRARDIASEALGSARQVADALGEERDRLERALAAQERLIAYRQSMRGWLTLPWMRAWLWWQRRRGT
ncbi:MAG: methyltransferase domain-containing protein [Casimicrobiaceae bacterium]